MKTLRNILIFVCLISTLVFVLASCGPKESLRLAADKSTAKHNEVVTFSTTHVTKKGEALTDAATYEITAGAESATLDGNKLTIAPTAKNGDVITVVSKMGDLVSNAVSVTVKLPENALSISSNTNTAQREQIVDITVTLTEDGKAIDAAEADLTITKGADAATLVGTKLTINEDAAHGTEIEIVATYKDLTSNTLKIRVEIPVTDLTISADKSAVSAGSSLALKVDILPVGLNVDVEWTVTEGAALCDIVNNRLYVHDDAADGSTIKVQAKSGNVTSNELTFTVGADGETFLLFLSQTALTVDTRNEEAALPLEVEIFDSNLQPVSNNVTFEVISGAEFLSLDVNGNVCYFEALGHGQAIVRVSLPGTNVFKTATVKVIVPPDAVRLPEVFNERLGIDYNFSMVNPGEGTADRLDFNAVALGQNVCTTLKYTFTHEDGTSGDEVAVWGDGKITFKKTGRVTLTVSSDSGSRHEVTATYRFQVNEGYNVRNYSELKALLESNSYNGEIINVVVSEKPVGANGYPYGYDLVPPAALKAAAEQTWQDIFYGSVINANNKNVHINGNLHKLDASQLRVISEDEIHALNNTGEYGGTYIDALITIAPDHANPAELAGKQHIVKINNFEVVGNTPKNFDGDLNGKVPYGVVNTGIHIGNLSYDVVYHLEMSNITASRCHVGLRFRRVISDSNVDNINVYNCFSNGIETAASIMTFGNLTFADIGAAGIEMVTDNSNRAGESFDQLQKITYAGTIDATHNLTTGDSRYLQNFVVSGYNVQQIIMGVMQQYPQSGSHMMNSNYQFSFVTFIFNDFELGANYSQAVYPAYSEGGIINANDLPTDGTVDTTHEYILLEIKIGGMSLGNALLYNHHYVAPASN